MREELFLTFVDSEAGIQHRDKQDNLPLSRDI